MVFSHSDEPEPTPDFGSHPSYAEIVTTYLLPRVESGEHAWPYVHEADVYAANPEDLTRDFSPAIAADGSVAWYFFTNLRSKNSYGQRKARTVETGEGTWLPGGPAKCVATGVHQDREEGRRHTFSFCKKEDGRWVRSGWLMMEFGLNYGRQDNRSDELVLCKVYRNSRAPVAPAPSVKKSMTAEETPTPKETEPAVASALSPDTKVPTEAEEAQTQTPEGTKPAEESALARDTKIPTAAATTATASDTKITTVDVAAAAAAAGTRCTRKADVKNSGAGKAKRLCSRCQMEMSKSDNETTVLDIAPNEDETAYSSEIHRHRPPKFFQFL
ncbi:hypothetical protein GUJ93_ZPchr0007g3894 [Zizania palustris]|uniref:NAC domain-containing protein n=1 Tax=Zizania palustris TaxID=103762 RepID=A0A8J5TE24_ZIZPA|nr:hypothetical protein GUJ93_ZPchr0007g3894 [Zizania palustris]